MSDKITIRGHRGKSFDLRHTPRVRKAIEAGRLATLNGPEPPNQPAAPKPAAPQKAPKKPAPKKPAKPKPKA